jgi:probable Rubsico expression protein CbbX
VTGPDTGFALYRPGASGPRAGAGQSDAAADERGAGAGAPAEAAPILGPAERVDLHADESAALVRSVLDKLDAELVGLAAVKRRIREIAALLAVDRARAQFGLSASKPSLHMSFTGSPGTGKTTVALRMAEILHALGYLRNARVHAVTREDLVGQFIGHTAPKTKEALARAAGGVLFIDEAYYLYRPDNERDYGQEAIEILLQEMESGRGSLAVIFAGYADRMETFFASNPGLSSRVAHHIQFADYTKAELTTIAELMLARDNYSFTPGAAAAFAEYLDRRCALPRFAGARSVRNALERARLRQASRLLEQRGTVGRDDLVLITETDIRGSSVFTGQASSDADAAPSAESGQPAAPGVQVSSARTSSPGSSSCGV